MSRAENGSRLISRGSLALLLAASLQCNFALAQTDASAPADAAPPSDTPPVVQVPVAPVAAPTLDAPAPAAVTATPPATPITPPVTPPSSAKEVAVAAKSARSAEIARVNGELAALQADANLAPRVPPQALADARAALAGANNAQNDDTRGAHLLYLADRKVQLARALAQVSFAQAQYQQLAAQAGGAPNPLASAPTAITPAIVDTPQQEELRRAAAALHPTRDRGALRFTVDDVIVQPGTITLTHETSDGLTAMATYLRRNPQSQMLLIGHAHGDDNDESIQRTAQSRADGVRNFLMRLGVRVEQISLNTQVSPDLSLCARCVDAVLDPPFSAQNSIIQPIGP